MQCHSVLSLRDRKICRERATTIADRQAGRQAGSGVASKRVSDSMKVYDQQAGGWGGGGGGGEGRRGGGGGGGGGGGRAVKPSGKRREGR